MVSRRDFNNRYKKELKKQREQLKQLKVPFALLHCNSAYPAPNTDIQLPYIGRLRELHSIIGYSGHERGIAISIAAVALGACIIERHITLDRAMEGPDHLASLEPAEFKQLVEEILKFHNIVSVYNLLRLIKDSIPPLRVAN